MSSETTMEKEDKKSKRMELQLLCTARRVKKPKSIENLVSPNTPMEPPPTSRTVVGA